MIVIPIPMRTSALMISTFSVSVTTRGAICALTRNSSIVRRVFEPASNSTNDCPTRSLGSIFLRRASGC